MLEGKICYFTGQPLSEQEKDLGTFDGESWWIAKKDNTKVIYYRWPKQSRKDACEVKVMRNIRSNKFGDWDEERYSMVIDGDTFRMVEEAPDYKKLIAFSTWNRNQRIYTFEECNVDEDRTYFLSPEPIDSLQVPLHKVIGEAKLKKNRDFLYIDSIKFHRNQDNAYINILDFDQKNTNMHNYCQCECHREGRPIMHIMACCDFCYATYLDKDGNLIEEKYKVLLDKKRADGRIDEMTVINALKKGMRITVGGTGDVVEENGTPMVKNYQQCYLFLAEKKDLPFRF